MLVCVGEWFRRVLLNLFSISDLDMLSQQILAHIMNEGTDNLRLQHQMLPVITEGGFM